MVTILGNTDLGILSNGATENSVIPFVDTTYLFTD